MTKEKYLEIMRHRNIDDVFWMQEQRIYALERHVMWMGVSTAIAVLSLAVGQWMR
jgi:hypothetical protein